jgi:hypothetical protein
VLIVGGGDSAVDWANGLIGIAREITLIHRRDQFRAHEDSVQGLLHFLITVKTLYALRRLEGNDCLERAVIYQNKTNAEEIIEVDAVVASLRFLSTLGSIREWGLDLERDSVRVTPRMKTNLPGVYAAGDIATFPGKVKLITTGFGEAATAINNAAQYLNPKASVFPGHSTSQVVRASSGKSRPRPNSAAGYAVVFTALRETRRGACSRDRDHGVPPLPPGIRGPEEGERDGGPLAGRDWEVHIVDPKRGRRRRGICHRAPLIARPVKPEGRGRLNTQCVAPRHRPNLPVRLPDLERRSLLPF